MGEYKIVLFHDSLQTFIIVKVYPIGNLNCSEMGLNLLFSILVLHIPSAEDFTTVRRAVV